MNLTVLSGLARRTLHWAPIALVALMPFHELVREGHPLLGAWDEGLVLLTIVAWVVLWRTGEVTPRRWEWLSVVLLLFGLVCLAATAANRFPAGWLTQSKKLLVYPLLAAVLAWSSPVLEARWRRRLIIVLLVVGGLAAVWGVASYWMFYFTHLDEGHRLSSQWAWWRVLFHPYLRRVELGRLQRAVGCFLNPNVFGSYLVVVATVAAAALLGVERRWAKGAAGGVLAAAVLALALTNSRGSMGGLVLAMVVLAGLRNWRLCFVPLGLVVVAVALTPLGQTADRLSRFTSGDLARLTRPVEALRAIQDSPLLGHGLGAKGACDMQYATLLHETGLMGLICFLLVLTVALVVCLQTARRSAAPLARLLAPAAAGVCVAGAAQACVSEYFATPQRACFFWMLMAAVALCRHDFAGQLPPLGGEDDDG